MPRITSNNFSDLDNLCLTDSLGIQFTGRTSDPADADLAAGRLYYNSTSSALKVYNGATWTTLGSSGSGGTPTWEDIYLLDPTFALTTATWTITQSANAALLTLTKTGAGAGAVLVLNNSGTGKDISAGTWSIGYSGSAAIVELGSGATINATDGALTIGKTSTATTIAGTLTASEAVTCTTTLSAAATTITGLLTIATSATSGIAAVTTLATTPYSFTGSSVTSSTVFRVIGAGVTSGTGISGTFAALDTGTALALTNASITSGAHIVCTESGAVFSVKRYGATTIAGSAAGTAALTLTAGDIVLASGRVTIARANDAVAFSVTNNTATTATVIALAGAGAFTGSTTTSFLTLTPSGLTTGTAMYLPVAAITQGKALHITAGATQTTGSLLYVQNTSADSAMTSGTIATFDHSASAITSTVNKIGSGIAMSSSRTVTTGTVADDFDLVSISRTSIINGAGAFSKAGSCLYIENITTNTSGTITDTTNGIELAMSANGTGTGVKITHAGEGYNLDIAASGTTSTVARIVANSLTTTGIGLSIGCTGAGMTSGSLLKVSSGTTAAVATNGIVSLAATGAFTSTSNAGFVSVIANSTQAGTAMSISTTALTSGVGLYIANGTSGITTGSLLRVAASGTGAVATNGVVSLSHAGIFTSTSNMGFVNVSGAATTAGTIMSLTGGALVGGVALYIADGGTGMTTGSLLYATSATTGAVNTNGLVSLNASGAYTSAGVGFGLLNVTANATTAGTVMAIAATSATTGVGLYMNMGAGVYTGSGFFQLTGSGATTGTVFSVANSGTMVGAGILASFVGSGLTTGTGVVISNAAITSGKHLNILGAAGASMFSIAANGATTIAGVAQGTNALTVTAGDITVTDGNLSVKGYIKGGVQTLTGAGAVDIVNTITSVVTTGADALTLADGVTGQIKIITMTTDGGDGTLTPTNLLGGTTITFNDVGDSVILCFVASKWHILANNGCTVA